MSSACLIFSCAGSVLALPIAAVLEVVRMVAPVARLPRTPRYCLGAIDYHGKLVPVLDLGARLGLCAPHKLLQLVDAWVILIKEFAPEAAPAPSANSTSLAAPMLAYVVDRVIELCDQPISPLSENIDGFFGLLAGSVRWKDNQSALVLKHSTRGLVPLLAQQRIRQAMAALEHAGEIKT